LVSSAAAWTSWNVYLAHPSKGHIQTLFSANEHDPELKGLGPEQVDIFTYPGNWTDVNPDLSFLCHRVLIPLDPLIYHISHRFDKTKTYPLLLYIHGGPQSSWLDSWSTRWNYKVWADQGYILIGPSSPRIASVNLHGARSR